MWTPTHVQVTVHRGRNLLCKGKSDTNDAYVTISLGKDKYQTSIKERTKDPVWHEECDLAMSDKCSSIQLNVFHRNLLGIDEFLGHTDIPLEQFAIYERPRSRWYTLKNKPGSKKAEKYRGEIEVKVTFLVQSLSGSQTSLVKAKVKKSASFKSMASSMGEKLSVKWPHKGGATLNRASSKGEISDRLSFADPFGNQSEVAGSSRSDSALIQKFSSRHIERSHDFLPTSYNNEDKDDTPDSVSVENTPETSPSPLAAASTPVRTPKQHKKRRLNKISLLSQSTLAINDVGFGNDSSKYCRSTLSDSFFSQSVEDVSSGKTESKDHNDNSESLTQNAPHPSPLVEQSPNDVTVSVSAAPSTVAPSNFSPTQLSIPPSPMIKITAPEDDDLAAEESHGAGHVTPFETVVEEDVSNARPAQLSSDEENGEDIDAAIFGKNSPSADSPDAVVEDIKEDKEGGEEEGEKEEEEEEEEDGKLKEKLKNKIRDASGRHTLQSGSKGTRRATHELYEGIFEYKAATENSKEDFPESIMESFGQYSRKDLIRILMKQSEEIQSRDTYIKDLEQYIDNLLVRVIEVTPNVLQNPPSPVKAHRALANQPPANPPPAPASVTTVAKPPVGAGNGPPTVAFSRDNPNLIFLNTNNSNKKISNPFKKLQAALK